ncbi:MAG: DUF2277 domain-containing protein [Bryobacteraceae bacterium]|jgi:hypothetical protein
MCRSIKVLRQAGAPATREEINAAALQFVRKISGMRQPSRANQASFERAVKEIAQSSSRLLNAVGPTAARRSAVPETPAGAR